MKTNILLIVLASLMLSNCSSKDDTQNLKEITLTQLEIDDLSFLREEEKLARDVYKYSYAKHELEIFNNISSSEQKHMNSVLGLMIKYGIPDSATTEIGVFNNHELQELYDDLTALADISLVDALTVGAIIEDLDIDDIDDFIGNTSKTDILAMYDNLTCGSKNHIRAYTNQLENNGVTYTPQYISETYYNTILSAQNGGCGKKQ